MKLLSFVSERMLYFMIITVTMNPAIDKTIDIGPFVHGGLNRISNIERDAGGKGINVSKTIHHLGGTSLATGFLAGTAGDMIEQTLKDYGISTDFIRIEGETRTNTKVVEPDGTVTELNEPGPYVSEAAVQELICKLESHASPDTIVVLAGSIPQSVDKTIYRTITEKMHAKGASILLDADGELFVHAIKACPDILKPNLFELEQYFTGLSAGDSDAVFDGSGKCSDTAVSQTADQDPAVQMGQKLLSMGSSIAVISMGSKGAVFLNQDSVLKSDALSVKTHSTVGAGDAMVAALAYGWETKMTFAECAALCMAASAGAVTTVGTKPPTRALVDALLAQVTLTPVSVS